jgi:cation diffusion facilitator family transporter
MAFPEPLPLPQEFFEARKKRSAALLKITLWGIAIRFLIVLFELLGYAYSDSSVLLLDALSTLTDVTSSVLLIVSIKLAERPPDREHPFGHGRYEPIVGLQLGIFLVIAGCSMFIYEIRSFWHLAPKEPVNANIWMIPLFVCALLEMAYRKMVHIAKREHSPALFSEAVHFRIDSMNSLFALVALILAALFPDASWIIDRVGAAVIALFMVFVGLHAAKSNLNQLLDRIPDQVYFDKINEAAKSVHGVHETEKIRIQMYGPDAHVDIDVEVDPELSVEKAHLISQEVRCAIQKAWHHVRDVTVHIEPYYENDH